MKIQAFPLTCAATISSLFLLTFSVPKAYAGCNEGLGILDPTCPGRIFNPTPNTSDSIQEEAEMNNSIYEYDKKYSYYIKRIGEHSEWLLRNKGKSNWWDQIELSARRDARSNSSRYYYRRIAEHSKWLLNRFDHEDWWNQIELSARRDSGIELKSGIR